MSANNTWELLLSLLDTFGSDIDPSTLEFLRLVHASWSAPRTGGETPLTTFFAASSEVEKERYRGLAEILRTITPSQAVELVALLASRRELPHPNAVRRALARASDELVADPVDEVKARVRADRKAEVVFNDAYRAFSVDHNAIPGLPLGSAERTAAERRLVESAQVLEAYALLCGTNLKTLHAERLYGADDGGFLEAVRLWADPDRLEARDAYRKIALLRGFETHDHASAEHDNDQKTTEFAACLLYVRYWRFSLARQLKNYEARGKIERGTSGPSRDLWSYIDACEVDRWTSADATKLHEARGDRVDQVDDYVNAWLLRQ